MTAPRASSAPGLSEVLAVASVGRFYGRCAPGARRWTLEFLDDTGVDDLVYYRLGAGRMHKVDERPGEGFTWRLTPGAFRSRERADPLTNNPATSILTTAPLSIVINQGSEPHIFRVDAKLALASAIADTTDCALVSSYVRASTYFNGGEPSIP